MRIRTSRNGMLALALSATSLFLSAGSAQAAPANDVCASAVTMSVSPGVTNSVTGTTLTSTVDGTATCGTSSGTGDVWYKFTVPSIGNIVVDTCGAATNYDSVVSVHSACGTSEIAGLCNDDDAGCGSNRSKIAIGIRPAGEQLWIRVSGYSGATGNFVLNVTHTVPPPPPNDLCSAVQTVAVGAGGSTAVTGQNVGAASEGASSCAPTASADVWYRVTAPAAGSIIADTCVAATFDTVVSMHTACPGSGTELACNNDNALCGSGRSSATAAGIASGQVVYIRVAGANGAAGSFTLTVRHTIPSTPPNPTIGPDVVVNVITDVWRYGTSADGTITAYAVGTDSCNPGDYPVLWIDNTGYLPDYNDTQHPVISQNMYRLKSYGAYSRFEHLGQSWLKHGFVSTNSAGCGTCSASNIWRPSSQSYTNVGGDALGVNCSDTYGATLNGGQGNQGAKNIVNPTTGTSPFVRNNGTGESTIRQRLQVPTADVTSQPAGTRFIVDACYVTADDAQFVRPGQTVAFNGLNNASWREVTLASIGNQSPAFAGSTHQQEIGLKAWQTIDPTVTLTTADHDDTPNPGTGFRDANGNPSFPGTTIRSRFHVASKATSLGGGLYRYEFAVYNHNSDRGANKFTIPLPAGASMTDVFFRMPQWHSGEPYSNTPWTNARVGDSVVFSTQDYATNVNASAIRWTCLYNFGFTSNVAPTTGSTTLTLFKPGFGPGSPSTINANGISVPTVPVCTAAAITGQTGPSAAVCVGQPASFSVTATGNPAPTYQWRKNTVNINLATSATYTIASVDGNSAGSYDCVVTNGCGSPATSTAVALSVLGASCQPADIAWDTGEPLPPAGPCDSGMSNTGVNEGDYNCFFGGFFDAATYCDIADDAGTSPPAGTNTGVNEGDYNSFFQLFFNGCP